jgi:hypothetical protein
MKREDLKKLLGEGATDEVINAIMKLHGDDTETHKTKLTAAEGERDQFKMQLDEANKQIAGFKDLKPEELQKAADDWKAKYEQAEKDYSAKLVTMSFESEFDKALSGAKVKYPNEVKSRLKLEELRDSNGKFIAERFTEQIGKLKTDAVDLFESDKILPKLVTGGNNQPVLGDKVIDAARAAANLPVTK